MNLATHPIVVIAASAGGFDPLLRIVAALPPACRASVFVVQHIGAHPSLLPDILSGCARLPVAFARHGGAVEPGRVYVAPPDHHLSLGYDAIRLDRSPKVHFARPAADPLFLSAAEVYGPRVVGVVLSGYDGDGAEGLRVVKARGGLALVQDPAEAAASGMPLAALMYDHPDMTLTADKLAAQVASRCCGLD